MLDWRLQEKSSPQKSLLKERNEADVKAGNSVSSVKQNIYERLRDEISIGERSLIRSPRELQFMSPKDKFGVISPVREVKTGSLWKPQEHGSNEQDFFGSASKQKIAALLTSASSLITSSSKVANLVQTKDPIATYNLKIFDHDKKQLQNCLQNIVILTL